MTLLFSKLHAKLKTLLPQNHCAGKKTEHALSGNFPFAVIILGVALSLLILRLFANAPSGLFLSENKKFERFTEEVFRNEMSGNTLNLHYTIADPGAYQIDDSEVSIGDASLSARQDAAAALENYLDTLHSFHYEKLSEKHRLTYDIFKKQLETDLSGAEYLLYDEPLSPTLGVQAQLPILLAEYAFRTKGDVEDYLALLAQIPDYFSSILSFEREKAAAGLFMSRGCAAEVIKQCEEFIQNPEQNYLIGIFDEKIDAIANLTADEKIAYKNRNKSILTGYVVPAYQELADKLASYAGSSKNQQGLYYYPQGSAYYQYLIKSTVGDDRPVEQIEEAIKQQMVADFTAIQKLAGQGTLRDTAQNPETPAESSATTESAAENAAETSADPFSAVAATSSRISSGPYLDLTALTACNKAFASALANDTASGEAQPQNNGASVPIAMLAELREKITADFPVLPNVSCDVKYVHKSLQPYLSPAFYLTPAIDDYENNVIYINPTGGYDDLELFTTLAHEGYPGHLYQSVYWNSTKPDLLRTILDTGGYTEGWATYVEMYAFGLWEDDPKLAALCQKNRSFTLGLASLLDIGIHYRGYSLNDIAAFLEKLGFPRNTAESLYQSILQSPANYLKYYVGYLNFRNLRDEVKAAQKEKFSLREFHRMVLDAGPAPFSILRREFAQKLRK